ncbi:MAG: hypothetical protein COA78_15330 [Blastopirellula sp.]|nr:MAG: hypothetical protein COA78_15330 [Blastopirellula sp.]
MVGNVRRCDLTAVIYLTKGYVLVESAIPVISTFRKSFENGSYDNAKKRATTSFPKKTVFKT